MWLMCYIITLLSSRWLYHTWSFGITSGSLTIFTSFLWWEVRLFFMSILYQIWRAVSKVLVVVCSHRKHRLPIEVFSYPFTMRRICTNKSLVVVIAWICVIGHHKTKRSPRGLKMALDKCGLGGWFGSPYALARGPEPTPHGNRPL